LRLLQAYVNLGFRIFPLNRIITDPATGEPTCECGGSKATGKPCPGPGKHPRVKWGSISAPTDFRHVEEWYHRYRGCGWGIHLGASGLAVLDVDPRNGGLESLSQWQSINGQLPSTLTARSGSMGLHYYFRDPGTLPATTKIEFLPG